MEPTHPVDVVALSDEARDDAMHGKSRALLALDGGEINPRILSVAESRCLQLADRVDILMLNTNKPATFLLHKLLVKLEQSGIDYRLMSSQGELADQVFRHLRRFVGIGLVMVASVSSLGADWAEKAAELRHHGHGASTLSDTFGRSE